ncbi:MAG TPA: hypothetical protein VEF72_32930 [Mycobacterium sp.]|nr:hypothetical protein [Mycobacterium sp.]
MEAADRARKTVRSKNSTGQVVEFESLRSDLGINYLAMVRAFYLDLAQWAMDDPVRWGVCGPRRAPSG